MKRLATIVAILVCVSTVTFAQLSGTFTVGSGGTYDSLGAAIAALNSSGVNGPVVLKLLTGTHNVGSNVSLGCTGTSSTNTITIRPDDGATVVVNFLDGTTTQNIDGHFVIGSPTYTNANLVSTNYVTIDGSNNGSTSKDMTFNGPTTSSQRSVIRIFGNNDNITVKNMIITNNSTSGSSTAPLNITNFNSASVNYLPDNLLIENNTLNSTSGNGATVIHIANSGSPTTGNTGLIVRNNIMYGRQRGMFISYTLNGKIYGNTISEVSQTSQGSAAITMQTVFATADTFFIYNNKFTALTTTNTTAGANNGVIAVDNQCLTPKVVYIYNNTFAGMGPGNASTTNSKIYYIRTTSTSTCYVYHNTFYLPNMTDMNVFGTSYIAAIAYANTSEASPTAGGTMVVKNNIIYSNESTLKTWGIRRVGTNGTFTSDYNNVYVNYPSAGYVGYFNAADAADLSAWQGASSGDAASKSISVQFADTISLLLTGGSIGNTNLAGVSGLGISTDIQGDSRNGAHPYMGADEGSTALPVELTAFTAVARGKNVDLQWTTATEQNNLGFDVERMVNGAWSRIGFVQGAGNSNAPKEYRYTDAGVANGTVLYRLKQVDADGKFTYHNAIEVVVNAAVTRYELSQNYPNPFNPTTSIRFAVPTTEQATVKVYDMTGREVAELFNQVAAAGQIYNVQFTGTGLASGIYLYVLQTQSYREVKKMSLLK